jgi:hypothetical protein
MVALLLVTIYYNFYSNFHFLPITEGWFSAYANLVLHGKVPYRDFYLYLTPLYVWIIAIIENFFGPSFFVLRVFGLFIICGIALTLFGILRRVFSPSASFVGVVIAIIYYQSGTAHISYDFTQVLTLFAILSIYFLVLVADSIYKYSLGLIIKIPRSSFFYLFLSGAFASCAFLIKQSNGSFICIGVIFSFLFIEYIEKSQHKKLNLLFFFTGLMLPFAVLAFYLLLKNAHNEFIDQIFFNAIEAKGNLNQILLNWIYGVFTPVLKHQIIEIGQILIPIFIASHTLFFIKKAYLHKKFGFTSIPSPSGQSIRECFLLAIFFILYILIINLAWADNFFLRQSFFNFGKHLNNYIIPVAIAWTVAMIFFLIPSFFYSKTPKNPSSYILAISTLGIIFGNGTSAGLSEISAFIPLAWTIAWLCNRNSLPYLGIGMSLTLCLLFTTSLSFSKFDTPYSWWGVSEPDARKATFTIENKILKNIYVSEQSQLNYIQLISTLNNSAGSSIVSFPNIPMIYLLTDRWPESKAIITWFDFLNDLHAIQESKRLTYDLPDTIAYLSLSENAFQTHERLFRAGKPLGQRAIFDLINRACLSENEYKIVLKNQISPESTLYLCEKKEAIFTNK